MAERPNQHKIPSESGPMFLRAIHDYLFNPKKILVTENGLPSTEDPRIKEIQKIFEEACTTSTYLGFLKNGNAGDYKYIQSIFYIPFHAVDMATDELLYDKKSAEELALFLWNFITDGVWWKATPQNIKQDILETRSNGFSLLERVASFGSEAVFTAVLDCCKKELPPEKFAALLDNISKDNFSLPQQAAHNGNEAIFQRVMEESPSARALMARPLGFTLLHTIANTGTINMFCSAAEKIAEVCGPKEYLKQLTEKTPRGTTPAGIAGKRQDFAFAALIRREISRMEKELGTSRY